MRILTNPDVRIASGFVLRNDASFRRMSNAISPAFSIKKTPPPENREKPAAANTKEETCKKTCLYNKEGKYRKIQQFSCILSVIFISKMVQIKCFIDKKTCSHLKKFLFDYILLNKEMLKCLSENGKNKPSASAVNY